MSSCRSCGHQLGVGRFCTSCGAPVDSSAPDSTPVSTPVTPGDWRTDTAERKPRSASDPRTPPAAVAPPPPPRYPLYADEVKGTDGAPAAGSAPAAATYGPAPEEVPSDSYLDLGPARADTAGYHADYGAGYHAERRSPVLWLLVAAMVLVLVAAGWWFLVKDDGSSGSPRLTPKDPGAAVEMAVRATAKAPETAPPDQDVDGEQVSYDASNMLDGVPETAWRTPGDAAGMSLTFTLPGSAELERVGLINGYAKTSTDDQGRTFDWYLGDRRVNAVVWVFDDGTKVRQRLRDDRKLQMVDVGPVTTHRVVLRLVAVSEPGDGTASRDFTAVSEVSLLAVPES
jgi:hypothetical protein